MYTVYSKGESCLFCVKAKQLLKDQDHPYEEVMVPKEITKDALAFLVQQWVKPENLTVPQIFFEGPNNYIQYIGGYDDLVKVLESLESGISPKTIDKSDFEDFEI